MTLNTFDSDGQCGYDRQWDSAGADPNVGLVPDNRLYFNSTDIKNLTDRVDKLDVHMFGPQDIKFRYWKIDDVGKDINGNTIGCGSSNISTPLANRIRLYHEGKLFWNGVKADMDTCAATDVTDLVVSRSVNGSSVKWDFGEGNKYALTSITQVTSQYFDILKYFSVFASNDNNNWTRVALFEGVPDPKAYNNPYDPFRRNRFNVESVHCVILYDNEENFYPVSFTNSRSETYSKTKTNVYKMEITDMKVAKVSQSSISTLSMDMEIWADGQMFESGFQFIPGKRVNDRVTTAGNAQSWANTATTRVVKLNLQTLGATADGLATQSGVATIYFDPNRPVNVTSLRFNSGSNSFEGILRRMTVRMYDDCDKLIREVFFDEEHLANETGIPRDLVGSDLREWLEDNPTNLYASDGFSPHYVLLESSVKYAIYPGNANRLWKGDGVGGGEGGWIYDPVIRNDDFIANVGTYHMVSPRFGQTTVILPPNPVQGDVVLIRQIGGGGFLGNNEVFLTTTDGSGIEDESTNFTNFAVSTNGNNQAKAGLVYYSDRSAILTSNNEEGGFEIINGTWIVFLGEIEVADPFAS